MADVVLAAVGAVPTFRDDHRYRAAHRNGAIFRFMTLLCAFFSLKPPVGAICAFNVFFRCSKRTGSTGEAFDGTNVGSVRSWFAIQTRSISRNVLMLSYFTIRAVTARTRTFVWIFLSSRTFVAIVQATDAFGRGIPSRAAFDTIVFCFSFKKCFPQNPPAGNLAPHLTDSW